MQFDQASRNTGDRMAANPLAPHAYQHDLIVPAEYVVVKPHKGHSTIFRVRNGSTMADALIEVRRRNFVPLYGVRTRKPAKRLPS